MKSFSLFKKNIKNAELVCILFFLFTFINILSNPYGLVWDDVKWSHFPRIDLLAIVLSVWLFKITINQKKLRFLGLVSMSAGILLIPVTFQGLYIFVWFAFINWIYFLKEKNSFKHNLNSLRLIAPFFVMIYLYPFIPLLYHSKGSAGISDFDDLLLKADIYIFGGINPHHFLENYSNQIILEVAAFCYTFYGFLITVTLAGMYLFKSDHESEEFIFMLTLALMVGYIGYLIVPAIGPIFTMEFQQPLELVFMREIKEQFMDKTRIARDCFPSLHTAITLIICYHIKRHASVTTKWLLLPFAFFIPISCVLLRYHYVVDVIAGFILALLVILIGRKLYSVPSKKINFNNT